MSLSALDGHVATDVAVVGAGITGLTTARLLSRAGRRVVVIDGGEVCAGVTGYTTAKVTALHSTIYSTLRQTWGDEVATVYGTANQSAIVAVRELVKADRIDCDLVDAPAFTYAESEDATATIEAEVDAATHAGVPVTFTTQTDLPYPVAAAVRLDGQAQFHPRKYCLGLVDAIVRDGGSVFERTRALHVDVDKARVVTDRGSIKATSVVLATHLPFPEVGGYFARCAPMRSYALAVELGGGAQPGGMYISVDAPTRSIRSAPYGWIIVGGEGHKVGHDDDTVRRYEALEAWARARFSLGSVGYHWSAQDYVSADHLPFIGRLSPGSERVFVATGFGKWGMTNGTVAAMILTDLVQGIENPWAATFDSTRVAIRQGIHGVVNENVDVVRRFVGDRIAAHAAPDIEDLDTGQGAVARLDGDTVAAFRDDDSQLHVVSKTCTHLGCTVMFNTAERSWDCPCHGSRFDVDGRMLQGPAVEDLATKER